MSDRPTLMLIDGMALAYRGHFALMRNPRIASTGLNTSAAFVFANTVLELLRTEEPTHLAVAFDTSEPTFRHLEFPQYKAQREAMPEDLSAILPYVGRLCEAFNFCSLRLPGWEADDIIGTLAAQADAAGFRTLMVTPDKDFAQLVSDSCTLVRPAGKGGGYDYLGPAEVCEKWGVERVDQIIDLLGLMGDSSDNIPGIPGIGAKTAAKLIADYGSMEGVFEHVADMKGKRRENLETYRDQGLLSKRLVTIVRDVPLTGSLDDLTRREHDEELLRGLFAELEFRSLGKRIFGEEFELGVQPDAEEPSTLADTFHSYRCIATAAERAELVQTLAGLDRFCFDSETTGLDARHDRPIGLAFCWQAQQACYLPLPADEVEREAILAQFRPVFEDPGIAKVGHHLKFDCMVLRQAGIRVRGELFDTLLAAQLCLPESRHTMDALAEQLLSYRPKPISDLIGPKGKEQGSLADVPLDQVVEYACEDADITWQLAEVLAEQIEEQDLQRVFREVELPLIGVLVEMEFHGITVDRAALAELSEELGRQADRDRARVFELAGEEFNLNSPKQLGDVLFERLALSATARKTKTGQYKTDEQVLQRLAQHHEIAQVILDYRMRTKLKNTYVDALPTAIDPQTGRVHTHYDQLATATGRLASHDPNLQNIPIRSADGREVRRAFVPAAGFSLLSADYSQIELRIAAAMSGDAELRAVFAAGEDVHAATAARLYDVAIEAVDAEMRRQAKTVNFSILFGVTAFGLSERLGISRRAGQDLIDAYYASFPSLRAWMDETVEQARETGYVTTLTGRRRPIRDIASRNGNLRKAAERLAINSPVQGTEADLIKLAMVGIQRLLDDEGLQSRMLLQVHDELVFELHESEADRLPPEIQRIMREALPLEGVPVVVEVGQGPDWLSAH